MSLSDGDKAQCMEIARAIVKEVLVEHVQSCPHGKNLGLLKAKFIGLCIGLGTASGGLAGAVLKLLGG